MCRPSPRWFQLQLQERQVVAAEARPPSPPKISGDTVSKGATIFHANPRDPASYDTRVLLYGETGRPTTSSLPGHGYGQPYDEYDAGDEDYLDYGYGDGYPRAPQNPRAPAHNDRETGQDGYWRERGAGRPAGRAEEQAWYQGEPRPYREHGDYRNAAARPEGRSSYDEYEEDYLDSRPGASLQAMRDAERAAQERLDALAEKEEARRQRGKPVTAVDDLTQEITRLRAECESLARNLGENEKGVVSAPRREAGHPYAEPDRVGQERLLGELTRMREENAARLQELEARYRAARGDDKADKPLRSSPPPYHGPAPAWEPPVPRGQPAFAPMAPFYAPPAPYAAPRPAHGPPAPRHGDYLPYHPPPRREQTPYYAAPPPGHRPAPPPDAYGHPQEYSRSHAAGPPRGHHSPAHQTGQPLGPAPEQLPPGEPSRQPPPPGAAGKPPRGPSPARGPGPAGQPPTPGAGGHRRRSVSFSDEDEFFPSEGAGAPERRRRPRGTTPPEHGAAGQMRPEERERAAFEGVHRGAAGPPPPAAAMTEEEEEALLEAEAEALLDAGYASDGDIRYDGRGGPFARPPPHLAHGYEFGPPGAFEELPPRGITRSASLTDLSKVTAPEEFEFMKRERLRESLGVMSIAQARSAEDALERHAALDRELRTRPRPSPPPRSTFGPSYMERARQEERARQQRVTDRAVDQLLESAPPTCYEPPHVVRAKGKSEMKAVDEAALFRARPIPTDVRRTATEDYAKATAEREELRRRRIKQRADELWQSAALPPRLHVWENSVGAYHRRALEEARQNAGLGPDHTFRPHVKARVPNYERLQKAFERALRKRRVQQPLTVPEVFTGYSERSARLQVASYERRLRQHRKEQRLPLGAREPRWPFMAQARPVAGVDVADVQPAPSAFRVTKAVQKRKEQVEAKLRAERQAAEAREREAELRAMKLKEMGRRLVGKLRDVEKENQRKMAEQVQSMRQGQKEMAEAYKQRKKEIEERVRRRPTLVDMQTRDYLRKRMQAKYEGALHEHGLDHILDQEYEEKFYGPKAGKPSGGSRPAYPAASSEYEPVMPPPRQSSASLGGSGGAPPGASPALADALAEITAEARGTAAAAAEDRPYEPPEPPALPSAFESDSYAAGVGSSGGEY
eukprot:tig00001265_g7894.t1